MGVFSALYPYSDSYGHCAWSHSEIKNWHFFSCTAQKKKHGLLAYAHSVKENGLICRHTCEAYFFQPEVCSIFSGKFLTNSVVLATLVFCLHAKAVPCWVLRLATLLMCFIGVPETRGNFRLRYACKSGSKNKYCNPMPQWYTNGAWQHKDLLRAWTVAAFLLYFQRNSLPELSIFL